METKTFLGSINSGDTLVYHVHQIEYYPEGVGKKKREEYKVRYISEYYGCETINGEVWYRSDNLPSIIEYDTDENITFTTKPDTDWSFIVFEQDYESIIFDINQLENS